MVDIAGDTTTQRTLRVGDTVSDTIEASFDQDWFRVFLVQGVTYHISLNGSGGAPLGDPVLSLMDSTGTVQVAFNDDIDPDPPPTNLNSLIDITAAATGTYYISARGF